MSKEQLIEAWKNPEIREKISKVQPHPSGKVFNELTLEELAEVQGASDVVPETTPLCTVAYATITVGISLKLC